MAGAASDESYYKTMKMQNEVNNDKQRGNKNKDGKRQRREHNNNRWSRQQHDHSRSPPHDQRGRSLLQFRTMARANLLSPRAEVKGRGRVRGLGGSEVAVMAGTGLPRKRS